MKYVNAECQNVIVHVRLRLWKSWLHNCKGKLCFHSIYYEFTAIILYSIVLYYISLFLEHFPISACYC